jgi:hypothetical protein
VPVVSRRRGHVTNSPPRPCALAQKPLIHGKSALVSSRARRILRRAHYNTLILLEECKGAALGVSR